jgi:hypothetical protein
MGAENRRPPMGDSANPPTATSQQAEPPPPRWRATVGHLATAAVAFVLGVATTVFATYLSDRVAKATQPRIQVLAQAWPRTYFLGTDPGLADLTQGQPMRQREPVVAEDYLNRMDRHLRAKGAVPDVRRITITVINRQNELITVTNLRAEIVRREKVTFAAAVGDQTGDRADTSLHFDMADDRPPAILQCGDDDDCKLSAEAIESQSKASYFGVAAENLAPNETKIFNALLDGENLLVTFRLVLTIVSLDSRGDRGPQELIVHDPVGQDFEGVSGQTRGGVSYGIDHDRGGIIQITEDR